MNTHWATASVRYVLERPQEHGRGVFPRPPSAAGRSQFPSEATQNLITVNDQSQAEYALRQSRLWFWNSGDRPSAPLDGEDCWGEGLRKRERRLQRDELQSGNAVKVAHVARADGLTEFQRTCPDHEITQRQVDSIGS